MNDLDQLFDALSDPTRRAILERITDREPLTTNQLAGVFPLTRWAIMKHLAVLRRAGLVQTLPQGRRRLHFLDRRRLGAARGWLDRLRDTGSSPS